MTNPTLFNQFLIWPIVNTLISLYKFFLFLRIPGALGWAVIAMTLLIRFILYPLTLAQIKSAHKLNQLKPHLDNLSKKHKDDKIRLQQEQMKLYKESGINPAAGCLPLLLQMPILIALYNVFFQLLSNGNLTQTVENINKIVYLPILKIQTLELSFLGFNLAHKPSQWQTSGWILLFIPVITGVLQYIQTKVMMPPTQKIEVKNDKKDEKKEDDMGTAMQKQMSIMMPLMIGFFAYSFPIGLSIYWNTFSVFGIIQQQSLNKQLNKENGKK